MTFRLRLTLLYSGLLIAIVVIFGITVFAVLQRTMRAQTDETLTEILDEVEKDLVGVVFVSEDGRPMMFTPLYPQLRSFRTPGVYVQFWRVDEPDYPVSLSANMTLNNAPLDAAALKESHEIRQNVIIENSELRVITRPIKTKNGITVGHIQAAMSMDTINEASDQLYKIMILGSGIALLISIVLGDWLARRALRPIANITRTAEQIIAAEDLHSRITYNGPQDELGYLITTLNAMISRLEKLFTSQQRFVADVSHELRTPITAIQSHVDLIARYGVQDQDDPSLKFVKSETQRMTRLVGDLLTLAQADLGYLPFVESDVALDTLVLDVFNQGVVLAGGKVKLKLGEFDQMMVRGDSDRLKQLFLNLITNAIKYTPPDGLITLDLSQDDGWAKIDIQDTGDGIPAEDVPFIFDRFYRVDKARARAAGGAGLGLSIAKWIAEAHQGTIQVASVEGQGTTFTVRLPLKGTPLSFEQFKESKQRFPAIRLKRGETPS